MLQSLEKGAQMEVIKRDIVVLNAVEILAVAGGRRAHRDFPRFPGFVREPK